MANSQCNREEEQWRRRPQFWSHPGFYHQGRPDTEDEFRQEPLLFRDGTPRNNRVRSSLIPWSPGQRLGGPNSQFTAPSLEYEPYRQLGNPMNEDEEEEREDSEERRACCSTARFLCCCCKRRCRRSPSAWTSMDEGHLHRSFSPESRRRNSGGYCRMILYLLLSAATAGGLYWYTSRSSHQAWTMSPGESRHVATAGFLTDSVNVISTSSNRRHRHNGSNETISLGMAVYAMETPTCPPLTGPPVTLDAPPQELVLLHNAFEYQYFYLNKRSTMQVTVHQTKGATNILVLKGNKVLARIQDKKKDASLYKWGGHDVISDLNMAFYMEQIVVERVSWTHGHAPIQFSFTSPSNDVYVLLYDNAASNEPAAFNVSYHMVLTTYDLDGLAPWCSHSAPVDPSALEEDSSFTCPPIHAAEAGCIIVQATESHGDDNSTIDRTFLVGDGGVDITLETTRQWMYMGGISLLPSALLALTLWYRRRKRRRSRQRLREQRYYDGPGYRPRRRRAEGPNYHYLPPQDDNGEQEGPVEEEPPRGRHHSRNLSGSFRSFGQTLSSRLHAAPTENEEVEETDASMIDIPAENIVVVKERADGQGSS